MAAIPYRYDALGHLEVLIITSRGTGKFIIPKGWLMKGQTARKAATIEAMQEAGILGTTDNVPIGKYRYWKRLAKQGFVPVTVKVFRIMVTEVLEKWPERGMRNRAWLSPSDAASLIDDPELAKLVQGMT